MRPTLKLLPATYGRPGCVPRRPDAEILDMLFYIAFIAIVNLLLGYALAVYLGATRRAIVVAVPAPRAIDRYETESSASAATDDDHDQDV